MPEAGSSGREVSDEGRTAETLRSQQNDQDTKISKVALIATHCEKDVVAVLKSIPVPTRRYDPKGPDEVARVEGCNASWV